MIVGGERTINADSERFAVVLGSILYAISGSVVAATAWLLPDDVNRNRLYIFAAAAVATGALLPSLPWRRWPGLPLAVVVVAQVNLALAGLAVPGAVEHYLPLYVLSYLYLGMTQPPRTALAIAPLTTASFLVATIDGTENLVNFVVALPVAVVGAEVLSQLLLRQRRQHEDIAKVLAATRLLVAATCVDEAAAIIGEVTERVMRADAVAVLVADSDSPGHFLARMRSECLADLGIRGVHISDPRSGLGEALLGRQTVTRANPPQPNPSGFGATMDASTVTHIPLLHAGEGAGAIVIVWHRLGVQFAGASAQVIELVATAAGPVLGRLRDLERLSLEAQTDPLTGIANRRTFNRALDASGPGDALVIVDLDNFKLVNDQFGHAGGDDVLRAMAGCLERARRDGDCISRFGGEEFAAVLPAASADGARSFLARLRHHWASTHPPTTFSSGYAVRDANEPPILTLGRADAALYTAKANGRDVDVESASAASRLYRTPGIVTVQSID